MDNELFNELEANLKEAGMIKRYRLTLAGMYTDHDGDWVKYDELESDDHEWYLQAKEIERLTDRVKVLEDGMKEIQIMAGDAYKGASIIRDISTIADIWGISVEAIAAAEKEST